MNKNGFFLSLKWKIAVLVGGIFLLLHSAFSYLIYVNSIEDFSRNRENILERYIHIAEALTKDSFLVLDQFAELFSVSDLNNRGQKNNRNQIVSTVDENWQQWQFIWGLEGAVFFDNQGELVKQWGNLLAPDSSTVMRVLKNEYPDHQIICPDLCFQFVMIPVMENSQLIGAFGVSRSFADTVIEYNQATGADIAVLVPTHTTPDSSWPFKVSAITHSQRNHDILNFLIQNHMPEYFFDQRKVISLNGQSFEISIFPVTATAENKSTPYFLIIDDISYELLAVKSNLKAIWLYGVISLLFSLVFLLIILFFSLNWVINLSNALPLLSQKKYSEFRRALANKRHFFPGYDELDLLNQTALTLTDQLEGLEKEIKENICQLVDQGLELKLEKEFMQQLVNAAPILVITQDVNGIILSINKAGIDELLMEESQITGCVFDSFIPETEKEHLEKLMQLRTQTQLQQVKIDGVLEINSNQKHHISWIHSMIKPSLNQNNPIILSLGMDISERRKTEQQMIKMATHDHLTGLGNRRDFQSQLNREIASAKRYDTNLALFYLDLDQFKIVNDSCGHQTGDKLLILVAKTLQELIRTTDILSRIGGDEFTLILPNTDKQGIENLANKINDSLMKLEFWANNKHFRISSSIGVAIFPQHGKNIHDLLSNADLAMYQAKESGRGQFHMYSLKGDYHTKLTHRLVWKEIIEEALLNDRFVLCYQPILDLKANQISHYECLCRIRTEDGKILMPGEFIGVAEELGLIGQIDRTILKKVIEQQLESKRHGKKIKLAVNLSGRSFDDNSIFDDISVLLSLPDVEPENIIFEITETAAVSNFSSAQELIQKIKGLGCELALDDFGVGFSSFYYLKNLPVEYVKIDGSFIRHLDKNFEDKVFVKALTDVSKALGKKTVAEFVENENILELLKEFGIDYAQGYYIGKPEFSDSLEYSKG